MSVLRGTKASQHEKHPPWSVAWAAELFLNRARLPIRIGRCSMALVCSCGFKLEISADQRQRLVATGERVACPKCGKLSKVAMSKTAPNILDATQDAKSSTPTLAIDETLGLNAAM